MALKAKPKACVGCARYSTGIGFIEPTGSPDSRFIIVGQAPTPDDAWQSRPFFEKGYVGERMLARLYRAGLQRSDVIMTTLVWCANERETPWTKLVPPAHAAVKHCWHAHLGPYLHSLPATPTPRHVVTVGTAPLRWFKKMTQKESVDPHYGTCVIHTVPEVKHDTQPV